MKNKIAIFDTTLRDGAQTPGIGLGFQGRYYIAKALTNVGVDAIEIGFAANENDFAIMRDIAKYIGSRKYSSNNNIPVMVSLARVLPEDVELAYKSIEPADPDRRRIHTFIGTSEELMSYSHGKKEDAILKMVAGSVSYARKLVGPYGQVEYSSEDALRTEPDFLATTIQTAIDNGADFINIPDTTGFARPDKFYETIMELKRRIKGIENVTLSAHVHNDSGNAVALTLKGIEAGIRQVEGCVLQLGERAGNVDWITVATTLNILKDYYGVDVSHLDFSQFNNLAKLVSTITGYPIPLTHPVVGQAAFAESSGIHVKGVINNYGAYFVIPPQIVGRKVEIVLGETSGTNTIAYFLRTHGYGDLDKEYNLKNVTEMTKAVKDYSIKVEDTLTETEATLFAEHFVRGRPLKKKIIMKDFQSLNSMAGKPQTKVILSVDGKTVSGEADGDGPIDSYVSAVIKALNVNDVELYFWDEKASYHGKGAPGYEMLDRLKFGEEELKMLNDQDSKGQKAIAKSMVQLKYRGEIFHGRGVARDITRASYDAIINAFDALYRLRL